MTASLSMSGRTVTLAPQDVHKGNDRAVAQGGESLNPMGLSFASAFLPWKPQTVAVS